MDILPEDVESRYTRLRDILAGYDKVLVAYSGGVDSVFLLKAAIDCLGRDKVWAGIGVSETLARREYEQALRVARDMGAQVEVVHPREMDDPRYRANPLERCFYCKSALYSILQDVAQSHGCDGVLCGTNADDMSDFRPGMKASKKYNVASPLAEAGLSKADIRLLSKQMGLATWDKPSQPCLASRLPYGISVSPEKLKQIEAGEDYLRSLGLRQLRVRHHDNLVRIEVPVERMPELLAEPRRSEIVAFFKELGFTFVSIDLQGFRSGSANEVISDT